MHFLNKMILTSIVVFTSSHAFAESYHRLGQSEQCGTYFEANLTINSDNTANFFGGGGGGSVSLVNPVSVRGLDAVLYDGTITEEGLNEPAGRFLVANTRYEGRSVVTITNADGTTILEKCP